MQAEPSRIAWVEQVAEATYPARLERALKYEEIADGCRALAAELLQDTKVVFEELGSRDTLGDRKALLAGFPDAFAYRSSLFRRAVWYERRARGQRHLLERVKSCRTDSFVLACQQCAAVPDGTEAEGVDCEAWQYCVTCRGVRVHEARKRFDAAAAAMRATFKDELSARHGKWSEKFLTLTIPHSGDARTDVATVHQAWKRYSRVVRAWMGRLDARARPRVSPSVRNVPVPYVRAQECTESDGGHSHAHAWWICPYLPAAVWRVEWGKSLAYTKHWQPKNGFPVRPTSEVLEEALAQCGGSSWREAQARSAIKRLSIGPHGKRLAYLPWPVVDVRTAAAAGAELVKYLTKDLGPSGEFVDPAAYAAVVEAMHGRRLLCASVAFWRRCPPTTCACCEMTFRRVRLARGVEVSGSEGGPRGPPLSFIPRGITVRSVGALPDVVGPPVRHRASRPMV